MNVYQEMSSTIESSNTTIQKKIKHLIKIIDLLYGRNIIMESLHVELLQIQENYIMGTNKVLTDYFILMQNYRDILKNEVATGDENTKCFLNEKRAFDSKKTEYYDYYYTFIEKENICSNLDNTLNKIKICITRAIKRGLINIEDTVLQEIRTHVKAYNNLSLCNTINTVKYDICLNCDMVMQIHPNSSELVCTNCGSTTVLVGTVFEDDQFFYQEGQRIKYGSYDPSKYFRTWMDKIQAKEIKEIPEKVINDVKTLIKQDVRNVDEITCKKIRSFLRISKNTEYNEYVPLIRKLITGIAPPQLTDYEIQLVNLYFDKTMKIYNEIKAPNKSNCFYHPYFIYKIIEHVLKDGDPNRSHKILSCIHLQSRETLIKNDSIWCEICVYIEDINYKPTTRRMA
jgi:hypothetical protein